MFIEEPHSQLNAVHQGLGGRMPVGSLGKMSWTHKSNHMQKQVLEVSANYVFAESNKTRFHISIMFEN